MDRVDFPSCCTAEVMIGMGQCSTQDYAARRHNHPATMSDLQLAIMVAANLRQSKTYRNAIVCCVITNEQQQANRVLRKLGFAMGKWGTKTAHAETKVRLCHYVLDKGIPTENEIRELFPVTD